MTQLLLFEDIGERSSFVARPLGTTADGLNRKAAGMELAASNKQSLLDEARQVAIDIARSGDGTCNADLVRMQMGERYEGLGPAAGSIFRGWEFTGRRVLSSLPANHARELKIWRLLNGNASESISGCESQKDVALSEVRPQD